MCVCVCVCVCVQTKNTRYSEYSIFTRIISNIKGFGLNIKPSSGRLNVYVAFTV